MTKFTFRFIVMHLDVLTLLVVDLTKAEMVKLTM